MVPMSMSRPREKSLSLIKPMPSQLWLAFAVTNISLLFASLVSTTLLQHHVINRKAASRWNIQSLVFVSYMMGFTEHLPQKVFGVLTFAKAGI